MIVLPKNLPPLLAERLQEVVLSDTLGEAIQVLVPGAIELFGARDAIFVFNQDSSDPNRCAQLARAISTTKNLTPEAEEEILTAWMKSGAHRSALQELSTKMSAVSFSEDLWPYASGSAAPTLPVTFPAAYNLLVPFSSELTVREDDEENFFGYFYLLFERFPEIEENLLSLIINLPKLISEVLTALNRHYGSKFESLSVFAHDFKQFMLLNEQYLMRLKSADTQDTLLIDKLFAANQKMLLQTDSIILSGREGHGFLKVRTVDISLNELVLDAIAQLEPSYKLAGIDLARDLERTLPTAALDPAIFPSVIHNLLDNARKYSHKGAVVTVSTYLSAKHEIVLEVLDQGLGIPEPEQVRVFSKTFRASNATNVAGHGLGLYLAKKIVASHGGRITVASKLGSGTCFSVYLPVSENQPM